MISDSNINIYHRHLIERVLTDNEINQWESDLNNTLPGTCLNICNIDGYKDTDDAFEVNAIDSIQLYRKEAIETQLNFIEKEINIRDNNNNETLTNNNRINLNNIATYIDQNNNIIENNTSSNTTPLRSTNLF